VGGRRSEGGIRESPERAGLDWTLLFLEEWSGGMGSEMGPRGQGWGNALSRELLEKWNSRLIGRGFTKWISFPK